MKNTIAFLVSMLLANTALADFNFTETTSDSIARHSAERYQEYSNNGNSAPLGGYGEKLGDTAPTGTSRPGYNN